MCVEAQGLTNVSGMISSNVACTLSGSLYIAKGDVTVIDRAPLTGKCPPSSAL
jgi:hypothetical protein